MQIESFVGFRKGCLSQASALLTACIPSVVGMLVYRLVTSMVAKMAPWGRDRSISVLMNCPESFKKEGNFGMMGCKKKSTNWEILSEGQSLAETMGLPGGGITFLCIY